MPLVSIAIRYEGRSDSRQQLRNSATPSAVPCCACGLADCFARIAYARNPTLHWLYRTRIAAGAVQFTPLKSSLCGEAGT